MTAPACIQPPASFGVSEAAWCNQAQASEAWPVASTAAARRLSASMFCGSAARCFRHIASISRWRPTACKCSACARQSMLMVATGGGRADNARRRLNNCLTRLANMRTESGLDEHGLAISQSDVREVMACAVFIPGFACTGTEDGAVADH